MNPNQLGLLLPLPFGKGEGWGERSLSLQVHGQGSALRPRFMERVALKMHANRPRIEGIGLVIDCIV